MVSFINPELLKMARAKTAQADVIEKAGFVDPAAAVGGGAPGMADPMAGAMPPMPAMGPEGGGDPAGGVPPPPAADPMAMEGGGGGVTAAEVEAIVTRIMSQQGGGGTGGDKMKVDVNTEIYHIKKMMTKLLGALNIDIEPEMLLGDPAMDPAIPNSEAAKDPHSAAASMDNSSISPIEGIQGASPALAGGAMGGAEVLPKTAAEKSAEAALDNGQVYQASNIDVTHDKGAALAARIRAARRNYAA